MKYSFHPEAEKEFDEAIDYFQDIEAGLGYDFAVEVYLAVERTTAFPKAWPILEGNIRRCLVSRFPYGILYSEEKVSSLWPLCTCIGIRNIGATDYSVYIVSITSRKDFPEL